MRLLLRNTCAAAIAWASSFITPSLVVTSIRRSSISKMPCAWILNSRSLTPLWERAYVNRVLKGIGDVGDHEKAAAAFSEALQLDPKLLEARMHMVLIYLHRGEKPRAREEIERLREEYPNDVGVHFVRGILARARR